MILNGYVGVSIPICLILTIFKYAETVEDATVKKLSIRTFRISGGTADLQWDGLVLSSIDYCEYSRIVNGSSEINITATYRPISYVLQLNDLKPSTRYGIYLTCYDKAEEVYKSSVFNFNTSAENPTNISSSTVRSPLSFSKPQTMWFTTTSTVEVYKRRFTPERSPTELGLGVAFSLIGAGVFGVVGYYVIKEYRRRIRIRRFLQYRRHENETFPDLADPEDEPVDEGIGL